MAEVAQEEVVEPKIENPQPDEKPLGETLKDLFSRPVLPEMTDVHLPLNLNIEEFKGEQLRVTGDTDITVRTMLLKVSSIDGNTKLDALDIDSNQGIVNASGTAQLSDNWPVDITLNSTLNVEPLKGEKVKLKVGGALREQLEIGVNLLVRGYGFTRPDATGGSRIAAQRGSEQQTALLAVHWREAVSGG